MTIVRHNNPNLARCQTCPNCANPIIEGRLL